MSANRAIDNQYIEQEKISIIVPVYNGEKYIERCVLSILNSSYKNIEVLVVNNNSNDRTSELCEQLKKEDDRVVVLNATQKQGVSYARNVGLEQCSGEYVGFVDSDDYVHPYMYELLMNGLKQFHAQCAVCDFDTGYSEKYYQQSESIQSITDYCEISQEEFFRQAFSEDITRMVAVWNKLYKKINSKLFFFDEELTYSEDRDFNVRMMSRDGNKMIYLNCKLYYYYRGNSDSICNNSSQTVKIEQLYGMQKCWEMFKDNSLVRKSAASCFYRTAAFRYMRLKELHETDLIPEVKKIKKYAKKELIHVKELTVLEKIKCLVRNLEVVEKLIGKLYPFYKKVTGMIIRL